MKARNTRTGTKAFSRSFQEQQEKAFEELQKKGHKYNLAPLRTPAGLLFAPVRDGEVMPPDEFKKLPDEERSRIEAMAGELQQEAMKIFQKIPQWERKMREKKRQLNREITGFTVGPVINELRRKYEDVPDLLAYLDAVEKDIIKNVRNFFQTESGPQQGGGGFPAVLRPPSGPDGQGENPALRRYKVNIVVDHSGSEGAPVVYERTPSYQNLVGRVEHLAHMGALVTDFTMIRPGALHRANGGYLILDVLKLFQQPFAWEGLKQALKTRKIRIESLGEMYGFISTVSLDPQAVPLSLKVILLGSSLIYYLIRHYDPEFGELFKVAADFDYRMDRTPENEEAYTRLIATMIRKEKLRPFDRTGVARIIEQGSRMVEDGRKLSVLMQEINDLLKEADYWAGKTGSPTVGAAEVQMAVDKGIHRSDRIREAVHERIQRNIVLIDSAGTRVGQINGLSVIQMGDFAFGQPSRITARIHLGKGDVVDIEREVAMGGPIHSKGVLILSGFLNGRFAADHPALPFRQPGFRTVLQRRGRGQRLVRGALCPPFGHCGCSSQADACGDGLGEPARRCPAHRGREREDRRVFRCLQRPGAYRGPGGPDSRRQCDPSHASHGM